MYVIIARLLWKVNLFSEILIPLQKMKMEKEAAHEFKASIGLLLGFFWNFTEELISCFLR